MVFSPGEIYVRMNVSSREALADLGKRTLVALSKPSQDGIRYPPSRAFLSPVVCRRGSSPRLIPAAETPACNFARVMAFSPSSGFFRIHPAGSTAPFFLFPQPAEFLSVFGRQHRWL
jgi:hypothetical protein